MSRGWLSSMAARVFLLLLVGITAAAALAFTLSDIQRRSALAHSREQRLADRIVDLAAVLDRAPKDLRFDLLGAGPDAPRPAPGRLDRGEPDTVLAQLLGARLGPVARPEAFAPAPGDCRAPPPSPPEPGPPAAVFPDVAGAAPVGPAPPPPRPGPPAGAGPGPPAPDCRLVAFTLEDGQRLRLLVSAGPLPPRERLTPFSPVMLAVLAAAAAALAFLTARLSTAPLQRLSQAAGDLGRDLNRPPLLVEGPQEVRRAATAFNAMQSDLKRREAERTYMLAAITHDLQTPLTRLRLRLDKVADAHLRDQLLADQAAMMALVRDGLDLARMTDGGPEPLQELDVDSLLDSLCADLVEVGADVRVTGSCGCAVRTRPQALKRCVANLLDNALKYAGAAELEASVEGERVVLRVLDRGPGIPEAQMAAVFDPFFRLETSRSRETGGVGLGLTIARLLAERSGAWLTLAARAGGGLEAMVTLPIDREARLAASDLSHPR